MARRAVATGEGALTRLRRISYEISRRFFATGGWRADYQARIRRCDGLPKLPASQLRRWSRGGGRGRSETPLANTGRRVALNCLRPSRLVARTTDRRGADFRRRLAEAEVHPFLLDHPSAGSPMRPRRVRLSAFVRTFNRLLVGPRRANLLRLRAQPDPPPTAAALGPIQIPCTSRRFWPRLRL
jgi:hypothetical protein